MKQYQTIHLVKGEDLNHHGTLYAARAAAWFVESAFIAAASEHGCPAQIVCRNLHGMSFRRPVKNGAMVRFTSRVVYAGTTSLMVYIAVEDCMEHALAVEGFMTFVTVEEGSGRKLAHGVTLDEPADEEESRERLEALCVRRDRLGA